MPRILRRARLAWWIARALGVGWALFRLSHALRLRAGLLRRRLPPGPWEERPLRAALRDPALAAPETYLAYRRERAPRFFFSPADRPGSAALLRAWDEGDDSPLAEAEAIGRGELRYFFGDARRVGCPPDWHASPYTGQRIPADRHWSRIGDFASGDIKAVWEASRFAATFPLVRAYWRSGDEAHAERFWALVESWRAANPPQQGPNWKCGQETSLRVLAWCFGLHGFLDAAATTPARVAMLAHMIAVSGERIEATLAYALSQRNNHGISEGMGLWTIGALFPEFRHAARWRERGRRVLEEQGRALIYDDGSFSQHSVNYHRLMLHDYLWSLRLGDLHGQPFSPALRERVARAGAWLDQLQDEETGRLPRYGQNDGALILPLDSCDYQDFRPVIGAVHFLATGRRRYGDGPWNEALFWLFGAEAVRAPVAAPVRADLQATDGGYYTLRAARGFAFVRAATFRDRPGQADLLHLDLWWRGQNMAMDAGTYSYNAAPPWDNALARTASHNTVTVDGLSQMDQIGKFLWLPWIRGRRCRHGRSPGGQLAYWEGDHDGYRRLPDPVGHRRGVAQVGAEHWLVVDELTAAAVHDYRLHWLLPDLPHRVIAGATDDAVPPSWSAVELATPRGCYRVSIGSLAGPGDASLARARDDGPRGWYAPYYLRRDPALSLEMTCRASTLRFVSLLGPTGVTIERRGEELTLRGRDWEASASLGPGHQRPLIARLRVRAERDDELRVPS